MHVTGGWTLIRLLPELTDGDFVLFPKHNVARRQVAVDDPLFLVQVAQCQTHLWPWKQPASGSFRNLERFPWSYNVFSLQQSKVAVFVLYWSLANREGKYQTNISDMLLSIYCRPYLHIQHKRTEFRHAPGARVHTLASKHFSHGFEAKVKHGLICLAGRTSGHQSVHLKTYGMQKSYS